LTVYQAKFTSHHQLGVSFAKLRFPDCLVREFCFAVVTFAVWWDWFNFRPYVVLCS
jgi:hypothetical protein